MIYVREVPASEIEHQDVLDADDERSVIAVDTLFSIVTCCSCCSEASLYSFSLKSKEETLLSEDADDVCVSHDAQVMAFLTSDSTIVAVAFGERGNFSPQWLCG